MAMDESTEWTPEMYVLARLSDGQEVNNYLFIQANSAEDAEPIDPPEMIPRPGQPAEPEKPQPKPEEFASGHEVAAFFQRFNA